MSPRVWLVTGASSGIGFDLTSALLKRGEKVVACARHIDNLQDLATTRQLLSLNLDVTSTKSIGIVFSSAISYFGQVDVVVNNAAHSVYGEIEGITAEMAKSQFDVNFFGAMEMTKQAIKHYRTRGSGGIVFQMASFAALAPVPAGSIYVAAKHAITGMTAAIAAELDPSWEIKLIVLQPGGMKSKEGTFPAVVWGEEIPGYENTPAHAVRNLLNTPKILEGDFVKGDPRRLAAAIITLSEMDEPPLFAPLGSDAVDALHQRLKIDTAYLEKFKALAFSTDWQHEPE